MSADLKKLVLIIIGLILFHLNASASKYHGAFWKSAHIKKYQVVSGQTPASLLRKAGFSRSEIRQLLDANVLPRKYKIRIKDTYLIWKKSPEKRGMKLFDQYFENAYLFIKEGNEVQARVVEPEYSRKKVQSAGKVFGSLIESIRKKIGDIGLAYRFLDAYTLNYNPSRSLKKGDGFALTFEKLYIGDTFIRYGEILQTSLEINGQPVERQFISFDDGGVFVADDLIAKDRPFYAPVAYLKISSPFNRKRFHPIKRIRQPHLGIDFELPPGAPVFAAQEGRVIKVGRSRAGGYFVRLEHAGDYKSYYNHLSEISPDLKAGDSVANGTVLGRIGCTGYCTKPHLHFGVKKGRHFINPAKVMKSYPFHYEQEVLKNSIASN